MKKITLNEQLSRMKGLIKTINEQQFDDFDTKIQSDELPYNDEINLDDEDVSDPKVNLLQFIKQMTEKGMSREEIKDMIDDVLGIPKIGEPSSVESDDYDEKMERNYGVDDEPSDDDIFNGYGREGGIDYDTDDNWQGR